ncbi:halocyanin domain-containing protein [Haloarchaeobius sp. HME9146]|uniref:halocyanin domain-containing protein n=1 Tax=Haloarchaeobius sp. HME9146 TaxID=2978732 RepID=UPI0021BECDA0|nr:halocyanin domain-containing protein [Haloarchaeobius sp. HME9146]MCT9096526.1 halocyanin domain-containing protein [Haloarchaeobius sp. HME9146]
MERREFLTAAAGAGLAGLTLATPAGAQAGEGESLADWFANADNVSGLADKRGESEVTITVGAAGNGGAFGFAPAAVRVDPGTTVVWEWSGKGGMHNVVAKDGTFESEMLSDAGATFEYAAESSGVFRYACAPHEAMGMKGALVVGDAEVSLAEAAPEPTEPTGPTFDGWLAGVENYTDVVDMRGKDEVRVEVGADGNGGEFAFEPAAIHVDPGTTVVWEWVGSAGRYSVVDDQLGFESQRVASRGTEYALQFDGDGVSKYYCEDYGEQGMRGVVLVGAGAQTVPTTRAYATAGLGAAAIAAPLGLGLYVHYKDTVSQD